jgi:hypothetical protein
VAEDAKQKRSLWDRQSMSAHTYYTSWGENRSSALGVEPGRQKVPLFRVSVGEAGPLPLQTFHPGSQKPRVKDGEQRFRDDHSIRPGYSRRCWISSRFTCCGRRVDQTGGRMWQGLGSRFGYDGRSIGVSFTERDIHVIRVLLDVVVGLM